LRIERCGDVEEFLGRADGFLIAREAEHNLILGLSARLRRDPQPYGYDAYLAIAEERSRVVAAALRTPPHNLVLSEIDDPRAIEPLAADAYAAFASLPGVLGPTDVAARFARAWQVLTGAQARRSMAERIYRAEAVTPPEGVSGRMRSYADDVDRDVALLWLDAFVAEALAYPPPEPTSDFLERRLSEPEGGIVLWEDGEPVSLAGFGGPTPNGIRIGPVYTPPERRRRGYASALVAELSRGLLETGRQFCFLFTDLANPTSNTIYQRVGYRPIREVDEWAFA
jgi:predicted GNAT family acetyltransferase